MSTCNPKLRNKKSMQYNTTLRRWIPILITMRLTDSTWSKFYVRVYSHVQCKVPSVLTKHSGVHVDVRTIHCEHICVLNSGASFGVESTQTAVHHRRKQSDCLFVNRRSGCSVWTALVLTSFRKPCIVVYVKNLFLHQSEYKTYGTKGDGHSFWSIHEERATDTAVTSWYETVDMGGEVFRRTAQY